MPNVLTLMNSAGQKIDFTDSDPTYEQTVTPDLIMYPVPTTTPTDKTDYSSDGAGGAYTFNLRRYEDNITITCLFRSWSVFWTLYEWTKFDETPKALTIGNKSFLVQITRLSGSIRAGQEQLVSVNIGLVVTNPA